ncbi:MAG: tyrosine-type recombinase/integrase [Synergistaceae bacterium]|nr:tyrosine-type recombinase/integrase [Synergistaceae bacterium]
MSHDTGPGPAALAGFGAEPQGLLLFDAAAASFLEHVRNISASGHTLTNYAVDLKQFAGYLEKQGIGGLEDIDVSRLRAYLRELYNWGYSKTTISRKLSTLRSLFSYLRRSGLLERDVTRSLRGPSAPRNLPRALSREAVDALFRAVSGSEDPARDMAVLELLYGCGLRVSELVGLRWDDVDMEERWLIVLGKGNKERRVPFGNYAQKALRDLSASAGNAGGGFVFAGKKKKGSPLTVRTVHRIVTALAAGSGLEGVTPHTLRHSCATHLLERGASLKFVQEFLGHESMATTQIYLTISASWLKESYETHHPRAKVESGGLGGAGASGGGA